MTNTYMLTTIDNPYNPFEDFNNWFLYDETRGYKSCERIGKLAKVYEGMSEEEINDATEKAIDNVIENDFTGLFRKVDANRAKDLVEDRLKTTNFNETLEKTE